MWHFVKVFDDNLEGVTFNLNAELASDVILVVNDKRINAEPIKTGTNQFIFPRNFQEGDVFEAYSKLPLIQPDRFSFNEMKNFISKALARLKNIEYGDYRDLTQRDVDFSLVENAALSCPVSNISPGLVVIVPP